MSHTVRHVPSSAKPRCPDCGAFVAYHASTSRIYCRSCGFALASDSRRAETRPFVAQGAASHSGPQCNAHITSTRQLPNGKIVKTRKKTNEKQQLNLFTGVSVVDGSGWLCQEAF